MEHKLSELADYLDTRRKSSSPETHRMREAEDSKTGVKHMAMCSGQTYLNLKTSNVVAKKQKFAIDYNYHDPEEDRDLLDMLRDSDEETSDLDRIHSLDDTGHEELGEPPADEEIFDEEEEDPIFGDDEDIFADPDGKGPKGYGGRTEFDEYSLPEGEIGKLMQRDPRERDDRWMNHLSARKQAWLKEAMTEGVFNLEDKKK